MAAAAVHSRDQPEPARYRSFFTAKGLINRRSSRPCDHCASLTSGKSAVLPSSERKAIFWLAWTWYLAACASQYHFLSGSLSAR